MLFLAIEVNVMLMLSLVSIVINLVCTDLTVCLFVYPGVYRLIIGILSVLLAFHMKKNLDPS